MLPSSVGEELIGEVRSRTQSRSAELKSKTLLRANNEPVAKWSLEHPDLIGNYSLHLTHKQYFVVSKLFDSTAEEVAHSLDSDMYKNGGALAGANLLFFLAPNFFGHEWYTLLSAFESFLRARDNATAQQELVRVAAITQSTLDANQSPLRDVLGAVYLGIQHLRSLSELQLGAGAEEKLRTADPFLAAIGATVKAWSVKSRRPISLIQDGAKELSPGRIEWMKHNLRYPELVADSKRGAGADLVNIALVDSKSDARVQIADLLAGIGRAVSEQIIVGMQHALFPDIEPAISDFTIWPSHDHMQLDKARETMRHSRQRFLGDARSL